MDCVNHSGIPATAYCQSAEGALRRMHTQRAPEGSFSASPVHGLAGISAPFAAPAGQTKPGRRGRAGGDSRRRRHVQRPVC